MTIDELAVLRWVALSPAERAKSEMGPPRDALLRVSARLRAKMSVAKRIKEREKDIIELACGPLIS